MAELLTLQSLPLFPLNTVLLPGAALSLRNLDASSPRQRRK